MRYAAGKIMPDTISTLECTHRFTSVIPGTAEAAFRFHDEPDAFRQLTPFPIFVQVHRDDRTSLTEGEVEFTLWFAFLPLRWTAWHEPGPTEFSFADRMLTGPMKTWRHVHIFRDVPGGVELTDCLTLDYPDKGFYALFTRLFFSGLPLRILFFYRHLRTRFGLRKYLRGEAQV